MNDTIILSELADITREVQLLRLEVLELRVDVQDVGHEAEHGGLSFMVFIILICILWKN